MSAVVALTIVEEARVRNFCMEAMWMRCIPAIRRAKVLVDQGVIGEPRMLFADFGVTTPYDPTSRFFDSAQGGGALPDWGVYAVSLAHLLLGAVMRFPQGQLAVLAAALGTTTPNAQ